MSEKELVRAAKYYEEIGEKEKAIKVYELVDDAYYVFYAAKIALDLKKYDLTKELLKKGREQSVKDLAESEKRNFGHYIPGSGLSEMMCWGSDFLASRNALEFAEGLEKRLESETGGSKPC